MEYIDIKGSLWKAQVDHEGEVKIILLIPSIFKEKALKIPTEKELAIRITEFIPNE